VNTVLYLGLANALSASVLALGAAMLAYLGRRPALTHGLWLLVLLKLVTPPFLPIRMPVSEDRQAILSARNPSPEVSGWVSGEVVEDPIGTGPEVACPTTAAPQFGMDSLPDRPRPASAADNAVPWQGFVAGLWLAGSACWFTLAGVRLCRFHRFLRFVVAAPSDIQERNRRLANRLGLARCPAVCLVRAQVSPMLWALGRDPRILIPRGLWDQVSDDQRETLLAHELAHYRRRDHWVRVLELLALGLYWWHPVAWWARRRLREAEEECCDALVLRALPSAAPAYAAALLEAVTYLSQARSALPVVASGIGQARLLRRRLTMIMRGTSSRPLGLAGALVVIGLGILLLPLLPTWAQTDPAQDPDQPPAIAPSGGLQPGSPAGADLPEQATQPEQPGGAGAAQPGQPRVPEGMEVHDAQRLQSARDEVEVLEAQLEIKRAEIKEIEVQREGAERALSIINTLYQQKSMSTVEALKARTDVEILRTRLATKRAEYREVELRLKQARRRLASLQPREAPAPGGGPVGQPSASARGMAPGQMMMGQMRGGPGGRMGGPVGMMGASGEKASPRGMMPGMIMGGMSGSGPMPRGATGGMAGMMGGMGPPASTDNEQRLRELERKLDVLLREVGALRQELKPAAPGRDTDPGR
jgi:beta-lactamase regulating signal transducer with metallopeptidase domain